LLVWLLRAWPVLRIEIVLLAFAKGGGKHVAEKVAAHAKDGRVCPDGSVAHHKRGTRRQRSSHLQHLYFPLPCLASAIVIDEGQQNAALAHE
jgi:hypothetical protein